jgi:predicted Zn-dependent peptidase
MMTTMRIAIAILFFASLSFAQKEVRMPKDLPPYGAEKPLPVPSVKSAKLDNGLTVWLVSEPGFPKVAFTVAVRGGLAADPADLPGISELLSKTVDQGTKARTAKQIAQDLQTAGGDLSAASRKDFIEVSTAVLASKQDTGITVLSDILQNASFPEAEVTLAKRNLSESLRQRESQPAFLATRAMAKVLFEDHPYSVTAPTQESIAAATSADLRRIFAQRFRPDQTILVAVGDFDNAKMMEIAKAKLGSWKAPGDTPPAAPSHPSGTPEHAVFVVTRPGSVQTTLALGTFGPLRGDPDYEAADVANAIYGGSFSSRLVANIREDKGYTYSPFSSLNAYQVAGTLVTHADVRNEVTAPSLNEIEYELNRLATTTPTEEELSKAKRYLVGNDAIQLQARTSLSAQLADIWVNGLPPEEIATYGQKVANTTSTEVDVAAKRYFPASRTAIVAVGEEKVIREALAPLGIPIKTLR